MHLILTGATGLVGTSVLAHIIAASTASNTSHKVTRLSILSRNTSIPYLQKYPLSPSSPLQIDIIQHTDFESYPSELLERLRGAEGVVWALGISQRDVSTEAEYVQITKTFALKAAEAFSSIPEKGSESNGKFKFVFVSGGGVTQSPGWLTPLFGRVKGQTELALLEIGKKHPSLRVYNVRPGVVDPIHQKDVQETIMPKFLNTFSKKAMYHTLIPAVRVMVKGQVTPTKELGLVLTDLAMGDGEPVTGPGVYNEGRTIDVSGIMPLARRPQ